MRRLWITRHKAMAASAMKMKVYIEDPEDGEIDIDGVLCRKLGELKNDQQKHFNIGTEAAKVFVVADKLSRNLCNEFIQIPEGEEDVFLSGRNYLNPSAGNPFRFDGVEAEDVLENRKKVKRRGKGILIAAIIVGILAGAMIGIGVSSAMLGEVPQMVEARTFDCQGLQITLTEEFQETSVPEYAACYSAGDTAVFLLREDFGAMEGLAELDLNGYGAMILANNHMDQSVNLQTEDGLTVFGQVITDSQTDTAYYYYCGLFKGKDAFWMVQITTVAEGAAEKIPQFRQWLGSVRLPA